VAVHSLAIVRDTSASSPEDASFREFARLCYDLWDGARPCINARRPQVSGKEDNEC